MRDILRDARRRFFPGGRRAVDAEAGEGIPPGPKPQPWLLPLRSSTAFITGTVCMAVFTDIVLYGLIVPVIPYSLTVQAGVAPGDVQRWTAILLACYSIALFVGSPVAGVYADHTSSRRLPLLLGLLTLAGATVLLCVGRSVAVFVVGRILQGLSAAVVWSVGLALLADTVGGARIGLAMGYVSIAMSLGLLVSPLIGGAVYAAAGYYSVYYIAFGLIVCDIALRLLMIEKKIARQWIKDDEEDVVATSSDDVGDESREDAEKSKQPGAGSTSVTVVQCEATQQQLPVLRGERSGETADGGATRTTSLEISPGATAPTSHAAHTTGNADDSTDCEAATTTTPPPPPPPTRNRHRALLTSRRLMAALFALAIQAGSMLAFDTVLPLFVRDTFHWSSTSAGLIFLCVFVPGFLSPLAGKLVDRYGARWPALAGFVAALPLLVCLRFVSRDRLGDKVLLGALLALLGLALMASNVALMAEIHLAIEAKEARCPGLWGDKGVMGIGYGLFTTAFALGGTVGSLMAGYISAGAGWATMTWSLAVWCAVGAVVVALWVGGRGEGLRRNLPQRVDGGNADRSTNINEPLRGREGDDVEKGASISDPPAAASKHIPSP